MNIFCHSVAKIQVQFWGTYLRLGAGKESEIFTRTSYYQYLSIIYQANIGSILYLFLCWDNKTKIGNFVSIIP